MQVDYLQQYNRQRWVEAYNAGSEAIDPFAPCTIVGFSTPEAGRLLYHVEPCSNDDMKNAAVNWQQSIPVGGYGQITQDTPVWIAIDTGTPAAEEEWGPVADQQSLSVGRTGYRSLGTSKTLFGTLVGLFERSCCGSALHLLKAYDNVMPGQSGLAYKMEWDEAGGDWVEDGEGAVYRIKDSVWANCVLKDELVWCTDSPSGPETGEVATYEIIGENGTRRRGKVNSDWSCGDTGTIAISIWGGASPVPDPVDCSNSEDTTVDVDCCTIWGNLTRMDQGDEVWIQWHRNARLWIVEPHLKSMHARATLQGNGTNPYMCNADTTGIEITAFGSIDRCDEPPEPTTVSNPFGLMGNQGDELLLQRNLKVGKGTEAEWIITQVEHISQELVTDIAKDSGSCDVDKSYWELGVMRCQTPPTPVKIFGASVNVVDNIKKVTTTGPDTCKIAVETRNLCVIADNGDGSDIELAMTEQDVVINVVDSPDGLDQVKKGVWVVCADTGTSTTEVVEYTNCP